MIPCPCVRCHGLYTVKNACDITVDLQKMFSVGKKISVIVPKQKLARAKNSKFLFSPRSHQFCHVCIFFKEKDSDVYVSLLE